MQLPTSQCITQNTPPKNRRGILCKLLTYSALHFTLYYSQHEDQEFRASLESLGGISGILAGHKRLWRGLAIVGALLVVLLLAMLFVLRKMDRLRREKEGADVAIEQALEDTSEASEAESKLTDREEQVLRMLADGLTSSQIADKICLSLPTIKWYRKKLMTKLDAANTAELISLAKGKGLL
ncbi:MAG: response regulator transcription factor [Bacteroidales bacterium]|nr:response regulator transcription factor [Bacteroidales bacterium]